ncbi:MAG: S-methyl-5'-thioadenosine phosphorylase [Armatimonadota bacterium]
MATGVIGGSGLYTFIASETNAKQITRKTEYGTVELTRATIGDTEVFFLPRHGPDHSIPPHTINYRANIMALYDTDCTSIVATNAVGSLRRYISPGELVVPDQYIDFTRSRHQTFYDDFSEKTVHIDQTEPYSASLREKAVNAGSHMGVRLHDGGVYICTEGPRFETPAEISMFAQWGADVVGMTGIPEVVLANELDMRYLSICIVTNYAAGMPQAEVDHEEIMEVMDSSIDTVRDLITRIIAQH